MAELHRSADREGWLRWAIEFKRRGSDPEDRTTVHAPHSPYDFLWGEMGTLLKRCPFSTREM
jgi:hypothetical protein